MQKRKEIIQNIEDTLDTSIVTIVHCIGQPGLRTQLALDILPIYENQIKILKEKYNRESLTIYIRSLGGQINPVLPIHHISRAYFKEINIIIHKEALSAATLLALGGTKIIMGPSACLGPIDPQIALNLGDSVIKGGVEDIKGYLDLVKDFLNETGESKAEAFQALVNRFPPEILGRIKRIEREIRFISERLLTFNKTPKHVTDKIITFLTKDIPSHDYRIYREEARNIGLPVEYANDYTVSNLEQLQDSYSREMYEYQDLIIETDSEKVEPLTVKRGFIESCEKTYAYLSELIITDPQKKQIQKNDKGWLEI